MLFIFLFNISPDIQVTYWDHRNLKSSGVNPPSGTIPGVSRSMIQKFQKRCSSTWYILSTQNHSNRISAGCLRVVRRGLSVIIVPYPTKMASSS